MTAAPSGAQLPRPGDMIAGKYLLDRLLGQGGMGAVFAAKHIKLSKAVAIKIMLADASNPEAAQRFVNEGRAAANIQNEHVVRVDDVDEEMGYAYMVLELLDGEDLAQLLDREPTRKLPPHLVVGYVLQALRGVAQAHAIGIVHRDLKPSNLFLARRKDGSVVVKVLDFGISKAQGSSALAASPSALTSTKAMLGSPLYMSPEQLRSSKSVDHRADIWAIGIILYELITGTLPFMGENLGELFAAILETDPAPLRSRAENVPPGLDEVVMRCLARKPENRWSSAMELANALAPFAQQGAGVYPMAATAPNLGGTAMLGQITPGLGSMPQTAAITGNSQVRPAPQMPAGAPPFQQTASGGWQSTGNNPVPLPVTPTRSPVALIAVLGGVAFAAAVVVAVLVLRPKHTDPSLAGSNTATVTAPPIVSSAPPALVSAPPPVVDLPPPTASASVAAAAAPPAPAPHVHHPTPAVKPPDPTPAVKPPDPTPAPKPPPVPTKKPGDNTQNTR